MFDFLTEGAKELTRLTALAMLLVLLAMMIDLAHGIYKAYLRGDARRSYALKRTGYKFVLYEGGLAIAYFIDRLIHASHVWSLFGIDGLLNIPVVSFLVAIFFLIVEGMSLREKADDKQHKDLERAEKAISNIADKVSDKLLDAVADRIADKIRPKE